MWRCLYLLAVIRLFLWQVLLQCCREPAGSLHNSVCWLGVMYSWSVNSHWCRTAFLLWQKHARVSTDAWLFADQTPCMEQSHIHTFLHRLKPWCACCVLDIVHQHSSQQNQQSKRALSRPCKLQALTVALLGQCFGNSSTWFFGFSHAQQQEKRGSVARPSSEDAITCHIFLLYLITP